MIHVTGPALAIILVVGYFGINAIAEKIGCLFEGKKEHEKDRK